MESQLLASVLVILGAFGWAVRDLISKDEHSPSPFMTLAASSAVGLTLNAFALAVRRFESFGCAEPLTACSQMWLLARCVGAATAIFLNFVALRELDLSLSTMIHCTSPLFVVLLGHVLLGERIRPAAIACIVSAAAGMVVFVQPWSIGRSTGGANISSLGVLAAFGSSIAAAFSYTSLRALHHLSAESLLFAVYATSLTVGAVVCIAEGSPRPPVRLLLFFGSLGTVTYVAELLITKGYAFATKGAGSVAVYKFLTPVFSMIFDASVFGEMPNVFEVVGGLIVLASSAAMVHVQASKGAHAKTAPDGENDNVVVMCDGGASNDRSASDESDNAD